MIFPQSILALCAVSICTIAIGPKAHAAQCGARQMVLKQLVTKYKETPVALGLSGNGQLVELYGSKETGTWTLTATAPTGQMCILASGSDFYVIGPPLRGDAA